MRPKDPAEKNEWGEEGVSMEFSAVPKLRWQKVTEVVRTQFKKWSFKVKYDFWWTSGMYSMTHFGQNIVVLEKQKYFYLFCTF